MNNSKAISVRTTTKSMESMNIVTLTSSLEMMCGVLAMSVIQRETSVGYTMSKWQLAWKESTVRFHGLFGHRTYRVAQWKGIISCRAFGTENDRALQRTFLLLSLAQRVFFMISSSFLVQPFILFVFLLNTTLFIIIAFEVLQNKVILRSK